MYRIIEGRGTGKTSRLMLLAKENDAYFICNDPHAMKYKASAYGIQGIEFVSWADYIEHPEFYTDKVCIIDELECFIKRIFPHNNLVGYSISLE